MTGCEHSFNSSKCEQCKQDAFVEMVGGTQRADRLFQILKDSYPSATVSRADVFRCKAINQGFTRKQADTLLAL